MLFLYVIILTLLARFWEGSSCLCTSFSVTGPVILAYNEMQYYIRCFLEFIVIFCHGTIREIMILIRNCKYAKKNPWQFCIIPVHYLWISNVYDLIDTGYIATQFNYYSNVNGNTFTNKFAMSSGFRPMNLIPLISWISSPTWIRPDRNV